MFCACTSIESEKAPCSLEMMINSQLDINEILYTDKLIINTLTLKDFPKSQNLVLNFLYFLSS